MLPLILTNLSILLVYEDQYKISQYSLYIEGGYINKIKIQTALIWRCGQVVKTLLFHGRIAGPTPASVTIWESRIAAIAGGCKPLALRLHRFESYLSHQIYTGITQLEECLFYTQKVVGSSPTARTKNTVLQFNRLERRPVTPMVGVRSPLESPYGAIAQLEKHPPCKRKTVGSNPTSSTIYCGLEKRYLASLISQRWVVRLYHHATNLRLLQQKGKSNYL